MMFGRQGMAVIAAPTLFFARDELGLSDLLPGMCRANYTIYEWLGIAWYRVKYGER